MIGKIGYACINNTLASEKIQVNRGMVKRTFLARGLPYASELALRNILDFERIINWNIARKILLFRMSSDMFPWMSEYEFRDLPAYREIRDVLSIVGQKVSQAGMRLTFHPGPFNVLASSNPSVVSSTSKELRQHAEIMDMLGLPETPFAKINIHVGGAYGNKDEAMDRFATNFMRLPRSVQSRLTVENDDKPNLFAISDLLRIHEQTGIPIVFDYLHHVFCTGGCSEEEAFGLAVATWPKDIIPVVHYSSSRRLFEDPDAVQAAHADFVYSRIESYHHEVDVMLEAKAKEHAVEKYLQEFGTP
jgi:UV DNA damage endonuclease